jgi:hypothetical protein
MIDSRQLPNIITGGRKKRVKTMRRHGKKRGGGIFDYDLLTGETYNKNAVHSINSSSGTQNTMHKIMGTPQEVGPNLKIDSLPSKAMV